MTKTQAMKALKAAGTAQNRKLAGRHGAKGEIYGVSYVVFGKLKKQIKTDHDLALELWATGVLDARVLATMIADPETMTRKQIDLWAKDVDCYGIVDAFAGLVAKTRHAKPCSKKWKASKGEWTGQAGWWLQSSQALNDSECTDQELEDDLKFIETNIHTAKNRVRHSMNGALISIGVRNPKLQRKAIAAAKRIGKVQVDHGQTSCKTPDAIAYIQKTLAHRIKRKTA